ncbi:MAG: K(+)-transporting ATPase subunit C [Clostridiales bacterium]|jgi:K+-transporting ATPase ATPase C chain|nr:K(+)-transporting ATPase subunit C [Clostridiales bacterium]
MKRFFRTFKPALICFVVLTLICGVIYPLILTGIAQIFPGKSTGSVITVTLADGTKKEYGSALIGQEFTKPEYLIGRPMEVSNFSPVSDEQKDLIKERTDWWHSFDPDNTADIPADLLTASGSGADPYISPAAAEYQAERIAKARNMGVDDVRNIIDKYTSGRLLGIWGEPYVNVLKVNLALDGLLK